MELNFVHGVHSNVYHVVFHQFGQRREFDLVSQQHVAAVRGVDEEVFKAL